MTDHYITSLVYLLGHAKFLTAAGSFGIIAALYVLLPSCDVFILAHALYNVYQCCVVCHSCVALANRSILLPVARHWQLFEAYLTSSLFFCGVWKIYLFMMEEGLNISCNSCDEMIETMLTGLWCALLVEGLDGVNLLEITPIGVWQWQNKLLHHVHPSAQKYSWSR
jgi:hypothetical protein